MKNLIVKDTANPFMAGTIDVGWRMKCSDGYRDVMWGNTKDDETLKRLIEDIGSKYGQVTVIDERQNKTWHNTGVEG